MAQKKKGEIGSSFDGLPAEEGIPEICAEQAVKQIPADQIKAAPCLGVSDCAGFLDGPRLSSSMM